MVLEDSRCGGEARRASRPRDGFGGRPQAAPTAAEPPALRAVTGTLHRGRTGRDAGPAFHKNLPNGGKV